MTWLFNYCVIIFLLKKCHYCVCDSNCLIIAIILKGMNVKDNIKQDIYFSTVAIACCVLFIIICVVYVSESSVLIRWVSLVLLIVQNAALVLVMRYARVRPGDMFLSTTAVVMAEVVKSVFCLAVTLYEHHGSISCWLGYLNEVI